MPIVSLGLPVPPGFQWDYAQIVSSVNITDTNEATGTALITSNVVAYDGAPVVLEFFGSIQAPSNAAGDQVRINLFEGATQLTRLALCRCSVAAQAARATVLARYRFTPTAGTHQYVI